jgi:hypothetical protein
MGASPASAATVTLYYFVAGSLRCCCLLATGKWISSAWKDVQRDRGRKHARRGLRGVWRRWPGHKLVLVFFGCGSGSPRDARGVCRSFLSASWLADVLCRLVYLNVTTTHKQEAKDKYTE